MRYTIEHGGEPVTVDVRRLGADRFLVQIGDGPAKLIASMTGTKMALRGREDIQE